MVISTATSTMPCQGRLVSLFVKNVPCRQHIPVYREPVLGGLDVWPGRWTIEEVDTMLVDRSVGLVRTGGARVIMMRILVWPVQPTMFDVSTFGARQALLISVSKKILIFSNVIVFTFTINPYDRTRSHRNKDNYSF